MLFRNSSMLQWIIGCETVSLPLLTMASAHLLTLSQILPIYADDLVILADLLDAVRCALETLSGGKRGQQVRLYLKDGLGLQSKFDCNLSFRYNRPCLSLLPLNGQVILKICRILVSGIYRLTASSNKYTCVHIESSEVCRSVLECATGNSLSKCLV